MGEAEINGVLYSARKMRRKLAICDVENPCTEAQERTMATRSGFLQTLSEASAAVIASVRPSVVVIQTEGRGVGAGIVWRADGGSIA
jgi:hypothetical protein